MYMDKDLLEHELHLVLDQFSKGKNKLTTFYSIFLKKLQPFCDGNGKTCKIMFANDDKSTY